MHICNTDNGSGSVVSYGHTEHHVIYGHTDQNVSINLQNLLSAQAVFFPYWQNDIALWLAQSLQQGTPPRSFGINCVNPWVHTFVSSSKYAIKYCVMLQVQVVYLFCSKLYDGCLLKSSVSGLVLKTILYAGFIPVLTARLPEVGFYATACLSIKYTA